MADDDPEGRSARSFTLNDLPRKLDYLISTVPAVGGGRNTLEAVARKLSDLGVPTTGPYLTMLRNGQRKNPSARLVAALAEVFGVPMDYFFDDPVREKAITDQIETLLKLREAGIKGLKLRSDGSELDRDTLLRIAELIIAKNRKEGP